MKKEYFSESLDKILTKQIGNVRYGKYSNILKDIFQRRAYEFGFSDEHMKSEIKNFKRNCKFITDSENLWEGFISEAKLLGAYIHRIKGIFINPEFKEFCDKEEISQNMYNILTHEVYHVVSARKDFTTGLTYNDENKELQGTALNEIFTEIGATRTTRNLHSSKKDTLGYTGITPVFYMLSTSLGIPEKELLGEGLQNREKLMNCISKKFPSDKEFEIAKDMFKKIEINLNSIYNVLYGNVVDNLDIKKEMFESNMLSLTDGCKELAQFQMDNDKSITTEEKSYRLGKIEEIHNYVIQKVLKGNKIEPFKTNDEEEKQWDNEPILNYIKSISNSSKKFNPIAIIKEKISRLTNKRLPESTKDSSENKSFAHVYEETPFDRKYKVRPEDLRPMEEVKAETEKNMVLKRQRESQIPDGELDHVRPSTREF